MPVEIRKNPDGSIDEIVAKGCDLHIEQMDRYTWYIGFTEADGSYRQFSVRAKTRVDVVED
jgi:hypothetical protein